jgi:hypothetical protein
MATIFRNISDNLVSNHILRNMSTFVSHLKLFASTQLAEQCVMKIETRYILYYIYYLIIIPHFITVRPLYIVIRSCYSV